MTSDDRSTRKASGQAVDGADPLDEMLTVARERSARAGGRTWEDDAAFMARLKAVPHQVQQEISGSEVANVEKSSGLFGWWRRNFGHRGAIMAQALSVLLLGSGYLVGANASDLIGLEEVETAYLSLSEMDERTLTVDQMLDIGLTGNADQSVDDDGAE